MAVITVPLAGRDAINSFPRMIRSRSCIVDLNPQAAFLFRENQLGLCSMMLFSTS